MLPILTWSLNLVKQVVQSFSCQISQTNPYTQSLIIFRIIIIMQPKINLRKNKISWDFYLFVTWHDFLAELGYFSTVAAAFFFLWIKGLTYCKLYLNAKLEFKYFIFYQWWNRCNLGAYFALWYVGWGQWARFGLVLLRRPGNTN